MCLKQRLQIICLKASSCIFLCYVFFYFETVTLALSFLSGIRLLQTCSVVNLWQLSLKNLLHSWIKFCPSLLVEVWLSEFWFLNTCCPQHCLQSKDWYFFFLFDSPKDFCTNMFTNTTSCFYVTKLLCHRTSDFDVVIEWFSKSWIFWSWGLNLLFHGLIEV